MKGHYPKELKPFPRHQLSIIHKKKIVSSIKTAETTVIEKTRKIFMPVLSSLVLILILVGIGIYTYTVTFNPEYNQANNEPVASVKLPEGIFIKKLTNEHIFLKGDTVVGGYKKINESQKQTLLSQPGIYENEEILNFYEPTRRIVIHIKDMYAIQTIHYLIQPVGQESTYDLYFHANTPGYFGGLDYQEDIEKIHEIARSFRIE
ncbi:hypothetical protein [Fredinandcohnia sp. 179-A 10B2 NHS]|uniref:hypothetical protein n=1 Tax=Fredinandcohnia sp. 179-A 10B2 NHS TaxID=3235176 RepID=UPI0039A07EDE